ncbi:MAG: mechanosensitive ion channel [Gammaproteobacteria bacterium]|nr:MAG: mechanosensitive ion channel [Gammaproteobacteria bacterium]
MADSEEAKIEIPEDASIEIPEETKEEVTKLVENINLENLQSIVENFSENVVAWAQSPAFYAQCGLILTAIIFAFLAAKVIGRNFKPRSQPPQPGSMSKWRGFLHQAKGILFSLFTVIFLGAASVLSDATVQQDWLLKLAQGLAVVALIYSINKQFVSRGAVKKFIKWVIIPIAIMYVFGWLDNVINHLDSIKLQLGNISLSLYAIARVLIFGSILFWLGRISNDTGKEYIRKQENLEVGTREVFAKLFEIGLFFIIFILLLQVMGISLTALAVFGGALGVGLGFGLQAIASNFISGLIILLDRSLTVGDYIELEDGRGGTISALNMRSTILETFDGKDIVVPNETFVTSSFVNWTHADIKQRYSIEFQVSYDTDMEKLVEILKEVTASHPQVISGADATPEEQPDAEISSFADSGIEVLVEFWMEGVDDGVNRVDADLKMMIWKALKENNISFPFPQREVRILNPS